jgi:hypothetical protein
MKNLNPDEAAQKFAMSLLDAWLTATTPTFDPTRHLVESAHSDTRRRALNGLVAVVAGLDHALNTLGMRSEGATSSAERAGQAIDALGQVEELHLQDQDVMGMLVEVSFAIAMDPVGPSTVAAAAASVFSSSQGT